MVIAIRCPTQTRLDGSMRFVFRHFVDTIYLLPMNVDCIYCFAAS